MEVNRRFNVCNLGEQDREKKQQTGEQAGPKAAEAGVGGVTVEVKRKMFCVHHLLIQPYSANSFWLKSLPQRKTQTDTEERSYVQYQLRHTRLLEKTAISPQSASQSARCGDRG